MQTPEFYEEPNHEHNLIIAICQRVDGVGKTTAAHLASYFDTVIQFMNCQAQDLLAVTKKNGASLLKPEQATAIIAQRDQFLPAGVTDIRQMWITYLIRDFVKRAIEEIKDTDFDKLLINPFLIKAFNFTDHREVISFCFYQKVTRAIAIAWEETAEKMTAVSGIAPIQREVEAIHFNELIQELKEEAERSSTQTALLDFMTIEKDLLPKLLDWLHTVLPDETGIGAFLEKQKLSLVKNWEQRYGTGAASIQALLAQTLNGITIRD